MKFLILLLVLLLLAAPAFCTEASQNNATPAEGEEVAAPQQDKDREIPTLSEWGMIIFGVFLAGWMARIIIRRAQKAKVGI